MAPKHYQGSWIKVSVIVAYNQRRLDYFGSAFPEFISLMYEMRCFERTISSSIDRQSVARMIWTEFSSAGIRQVSGMQLPSDIQRSTSEDTVTKIK